MKINADILKSISPHCLQADELGMMMERILPVYNINTPLRVNHFLAQTAHESNGFTTFQENLNYSEEGLTKNFPSYFLNVNPKNYAHKPDKIGSRIYANRMGNGDEASGEGWRFRGRGLIQLTGKENYEAFMITTGEPVLTDPDYFCCMEGAVKSACWFWRKYDVNHPADVDNIEAVTRKINGGLNGLKSRKEYYAIVKRLNKLIFS